MPSQEIDTGIAITLFSEVVAAEQVIKSCLSRTLPKGMEVSHFSVLNQLSSAGERTPVHLAQSFNVTKGAMTNTLKKLEAAGYIHVRPDWDDARKKLVSISNSGEAARESAMKSVLPLFEAVIESLGPAPIKQTLPVLREFRRVLEEWS